MHSVLNWPDRQFLSLFCIDKLDELLKQNDIQNAKSHILDHYANRIRKGWLAAPRTITDLRVNLDELEDENLFEIANSILDYKISPEGTAPRTKPNGMIDWCYNPIGSREWILRLNRHQWWPLLGSAYGKSGDERYANAFVNQLVNWILNNPPPIKREENSPTWRLMEVALRLRVSWIPCFGLFYHSPEFKDDIKILMLRSIYDHARFLSFFKTTRNHLLRESNGLAYVSTYYPEFRDAKKWLQIALSRFEKEVKKQINQDGSHIEMSTGYQWLAVDEFEQMYKLLRTKNLSLPNENLASYLEKMYSMLAYVVRPDGTFPEINDGFIRWSYHRLTRAGKIFDRDDLTYIGTAGQEGSPPQKTSVGFNDAGLYVMRSDWTKNTRYLIFDAGPYGGYHGHEDKLSIELYAFGQPFIVDSGSYTYDREDPYRSYFVGSQGHNTVLVDEMSQIRRWYRINMNPQPAKGNYATWVSRAEFDYVSSSYSEGYSAFSLKKPANPKIIDDVIHTRRILFVKPDYWIMVDEVQAARSHDYQLIFHTPPEILPIILEDNKVVLTNKSKAARLYLIPANPETIDVHWLKGSKNPIQGWYSLDHHCKTPSATVIFEQKNKSTTVLATLLYPVHFGQTDDELRIEPIEVTGGSGIAFTVITPFGRDYFMFSRDNSVKRFASFQSKGIVAGVRKDRQGNILSQLESGVEVNSRYLNYDSNNNPKRL